jgi:hypothetical protein
MEQEEYLRCPECPEELWISPRDPDASFSDMLSHIRSLHWTVDQTPSVLWKRIRKVQR